MPMSGSHSASTWSPSDSEATSISARLPSSSFEKPSKNGRHCVLSSLRTVMTGLLLDKGCISSLLAPVLIANQPIHRAERKNRRRQSEHLCRIRGRQIDDHQLTDDGQ